MNALTANLRMELRESFLDIHVSLVSPGVVATDFGLKALHGGPDSRSLPMAQPVEEVAAVIVEVIERPRADVYTRPGMRGARGRVPRGGGHWRGGSRAAVRDAGAERLRRRPV